MNEVDRQIMRSFERIKDEVEKLGPLLRVAQGECDGVSDAGAPCVLVSTHRGTHADAEGNRWLDDPE